MSLKRVFLWLVPVAVLAGISCKKGTFDINSPNPNALAPTSVPAKYYLTSSLAATANLLFTGGNGSFYGGDLLNTWMGYWSASGGFTPSPTVVLYQLTNGTGTGNWDDAYLNLKNYAIIHDLSVSDPTQVNYVGMSLVMEAFVLQRVVDLYNDAPLSTAFSSTNLTPTYDKGSDVYKKIVAKIDSAVTLFNANLANKSAENPGKYDVLFKGDMSKWIRFANTVKLKILMRQTQLSGSASYITSELSGLTAASFLKSGENAGVNPGYSTASNTQENPYYLDVAYTVTGSAGTNFNYWRANSYAVGFYAANNDPRISYFYALNKNGIIQGRKFGSTAGNESNDFISAVSGPGNAKSAAQDAVILGAFESFFLQAEAVLKGYMAGNDAQLYQTAVEESFSLLGIPSAVSAADTYISQGGNNRVNYVTSTDKITTLITQKWAACNSFDALESYSDWRRLKIPADLPVSDYPGSQATHIPYRLLYPTSETSYNSANVGKEGNIDLFNSKIFWQP